MFPYDDSPDHVAVTPEASAHLSALAADPYQISFANTVFSAAAQTGRRVRIIDRFCQGADHPVSIYHPEGEYLKGLLLYVE